MGVPQRVTLTMLCCQSFPSTSLKGEDVAQPLSIRTIMGSWRSPGSVAHGAEAIV